MEGDGLMKRMFEKSERNRLAIQSFCQWLISWLVVYLRSVVVGVAEQPNSITSKAASSTEGGVLSKHRCCHEQTLERLVYVSNMSISGEQNL